MFKTKKISVEDIHKEFFSTVDRLIEESKQISVIETDDAKMSKAKRLLALGFSQSEDVSSTIEEEARILSLKKDNEKKERLARAIDYFSQKYPLYRFITKEKVEELCEKYGLMYGGVYRYKGTVPDKNLEHIENFKIDPDDEAYEYQSIISPRSHDKEGVNYIEESGHSYKVIRQGANAYLYNKLSLEIVAPAKDFDTKGMTVKGHKLMPVPDPVVLKPVGFEGSLYYLIVTAWGDEAADVVNPIHN